MNLDRNELASIIKECIMESVNEGVNTEGLNETHFAVNKQTKKIVFGWDYHDVEGSELRQYARDYFTQDLIDLVEVNPKDYVIWTKKTCIKNGVDPDDDNNWFNPANNITENIEGGTRIEMGRGQLSVEDSYRRIEDSLERLKRVADDMAESNYYETEESVVRCAINDIKREIEYIREHC